jgi:N-acetylglucosaminyldiphosphoundecaprenol N-acetyl-beta-D-mannosaminyltransferase
MEHIERVRILDVPVDLVTMPKALEYVDNLLRGTKVGNTIMALNPRKVISLNNDPQLKEFFENSTLIIPDGMGVVWAVKWLFGKGTQRVTGIDLMDHICQLAAQEGYKIFVLGATEEVSCKAVRRLRIKHPGISIVGRSNGYIPEESIDGLIKKLNNSGAEILFLALGSPKQEKFLQYYLPQLRVKICQGVGGALDVISGKKKRAPKFLRMIGLEGFYRLLNNPSRYSNYKYLLEFFMKILRSRISRKSPAK